MKLKSKSKKTQNSDSNFKVDPCISYTIYKIMCAKVHIICQTYQPIQTAPKSMIVGQMIKIISILFRKTGGQ